MIWKWFINIRFVYLRCSCLFFSNSWPGCSHPTKQIASRRTKQLRSQVTNSPLTTIIPYSMFLVKWVPIFSKQTWILAKSSHFIESPFSLEHKISRKKRSDRHFRCFCGEFCTFSANHFHFTEFPFYREKIAADFVQKFPFYRIPILSRMYCIRVRSWK